MRFSNFRRGFSLTRSSVLKGDSAEFKVEIADCNGEHLDGEVEWVLKTGSAELRKGRCGSGKDLKIDLSGKPAGLYTIEFSKTYEYTVAYAAIFVTRRSRIYNPMQPYS